MEMVGASAFAVAERRRARLEHAIRSPLMSMTSSMSSPFTRPFAITLARSSTGQARRSSVISLKYWMNVITDTSSR